MMSMFAIAEGKWTGDGRDGSGDGRDSSSGYPLLPLVYSLPGRELGGGSGAFGTTFGAPGKLAVIKTIALGRQHMLHRKIGRTI